MLSKEILWQIKYIPHGVGNEAIFVTEEYLEYPEDWEDVIYSLPREVSDKYEHFYDVIFHHTKIICCYLQEKKEGEAK